MRTASMLLLLLLSSSVALQAQEAPEATTAPRPMTVDDALNMVDVGAGLIAPDGSNVLYTRRVLDWEDNEYDTEVWMAPADGGEPYRYLGEDGGSDFAFSPDGSYLTFKRRVGEGRNATQQLFWMRTAGGEAVQLSKHATAVGSYAWAEDSSRIFFVADEEQPKDLKQAMDKGDDAIFVDEGPNGQTRDSWSNLWSFDVAAKTEKRLTDGEQLISNPAPSPDGRWVAFTARASNRRNDADKNEIYVLDLETGARTQLTHNRAPEGGLVWAPDGRAFLFQAADDKEWLNRNTKLWLMDARLAEHRLLSGAFEGGISNPVWSPDGAAVLFTGQQGVHSDLFRLDVASGAVTRLTESDGWMRVASYTRDRSRYAYTWSDPDTPGDLWLGSVDGAEPVRLTDANPWVEEELLLAHGRAVQWESTDGTDVEGMLHVPAGVDEDAEGSYPLLLHIHGGPAGFFSAAFSARYHIYAGLGYVQLSPNVRGSSGYTDALREGNTVASGDGIGYGDFQDLMTGVDALVARGIVDSERMGVRGWSYGGILGGWTITQTDRFKAASIGAGVYDWTSEYGPGFNNDVRLWHIGGTPWDNPEAYRQQSALTHVAQVTTPTLLLHGMQDTTDTEPQSMMFFTALKDIGNAPVRYLRFPREPHGFREPRHQRRRDVEELRWMQKHVLGLEWEPWERPATKKDEDKDEDKEQEQARIAPPRLAREHAIR